LPIYEYRCEVCGHTLEVFQKFSDDPLETCEVCGGHVSKVLHPVAIHFKGSGFYTTDYGRGSSKARAANEAARTADEAKPASSDTSKTADKPASGAAGNGGGASAKKSEGKSGGDAASRPSTTDKTG
jgi:putative FmdB family regulatory protein